MSLVVLIFFNVTSWNSELTHYQTIYKYFIQLLGISYDR